MALNIEELRLRARRKLPRAVFDFIDGTEEIAREAPGDHWFQLYVWRDRALTEKLIDRAAASGYRVLVVTLRRAMALMGCRRISDLGRGCLRPRAAAGSG